MDLVLIGIIIFSFLIIAVYLFLLFKVEQKETKQIKKIKILKKETVSQGGYVDILSEDLYNYIKKEMFDIGLKTNTRPLNFKYIKKQY